MVQFPHVLPVVRPLYASSSSSANPEELRTAKVCKQRSLELARKNAVAPITRCLSEDATERRHIVVLNARPGIKYLTCNVSVKIVNNTKMYEPVSNSCGTFSDRSFQTSIHIDDDSNRRDKETKNIDNKIKASVVPEKPPRRIKHQKVSHSENLVPEVLPTVPKKNRRDSGIKLENDNRVDLEDINRFSVETEKNYKNRFVSIGVQISPLPPYRLRVLPKSMRKVKSDPEKCDCNKDRVALCCTAVGRWMFSQVGLSVIIVIWALLGAAAFHKTEGPREQEQAEELTTLQNNLAIELATELRQVVPHEPVWLSMVQNYFAKHETLLLNAVSAGYGEGGGGGHIWTYPGCLLFAVSLLTTLGFGAPVPRTTLGRGAAVLFSAVGIPLHFLLVLNIGVLIASKLQSLATKKPKQQQQQSSPSANSITSNSIINQPQWLKWFPVAAIAVYYLLGVILFGFVRQRNFADSLMFPLDFTATGGVAKTLGHVRILYALYLEIAVTLAATAVALLQVSASKGIISLGLRLGLLTNT